MKLDNMTANIRLRSPWEACDLGFAMVTHNWRTVFPAWSLLLLAFALLVFVLLPERYLGYAPLLLWWFKPLYDRVLLHVYSRQVFAEPLSTADIFSALPSLVARTGLFSAMTWRRLSLSRGFNLPIWQLEQLRGKPRKERQNLLHLQSHSHAVWLTIACLHLELVIIVSLYACVLLLDPTDHAKDYMLGIFEDSFDTETRYWGELIYFVVYTITVWLIEPLYMAGSFSLYLNRRTQLEAWDIELVFRSLGERLRGLTQQAFVLAFAVLTLGLLLAPATPALADERTQTEYLASEPLPASESRARIDEIMQLDDFSRMRKVEHWMPREKDEPKPEDISEWAQSIQVAFASATKGLLWIAVIVLVVLAIVYRRQILAMLKPVRRKEKLHTPPDILFGMDIRPESLPDDIATHSRALWDAGQYREALSLLYRGALMRLTRHEQLPIADSHTEGDILQLAGQQLKGQKIIWLTAVTCVWQETAYAHRTPDTARVYPLFADWSLFIADGEASA
jgi:hypothetical protein